MALGTCMRHRNWRLIMVGMIMMAMAAAFFIGMQTAAPKSTDPLALMQIVGQVSGVVGALGLVLLGYGLVGRRAQAAHAKARCPNSDAKAHGFPGALSS